MEKGAKQWERFGCETGSGLQQRRGYLSSKAVEVGLWTLNYQFVLAFR